MALPQTRKKNPGMSRFARERCRRLVIMDLATKPGDYRVQLQVFDSDNSGGKRPVNTVLVRTKADFRRLCVSLCRKYRIPKANVEDRRVQPRQEPKPQV